MADIIIIIIIIIIRNGYKKQLIKNIQNPFYFMALYNKAKKKDNQKPTVFSKEAMDYVGVLAKKYRLKS
jgi:hypothetical protein